MKTIFVSLNFTENELDVLRDCFKNSGIEMTAQVISQNFHEAKSRLEDKNPWMACIVKLGNSEQDKDIKEVIKYSEQNGIILDFFCTLETQGKIQKLAPKLNANFYNIESQNLNENFRLFIRNLFPSGFKELCRKAAIHSGKIVFPKLPLNLTEIPSPTVQGDMYVYSEISDQFISGSVSVTINVDSLKKKFADYKEMKAELILDHFKEYLNQLHGALSFNLNKYLNINLVVSLPIGIINFAGPLHSSSIPMPRPSFHFEDSDHIILIRFEFLTLGLHPQIRDLRGKELEFSVPQLVELF